MERWEQLPDESPVAFAAFVAYRDTEGKRSIRKTADEQQKSKSMLERWSRQHEWVARAAAYDRHKDAVRLSATTQRIEDAQAHRDEMFGVFGQAVASRVHRVVATDGPTTELQRLQTMWITLQNEQRDERLAVEERSAIEHVAERLDAVALRHLPAKKVPAYRRDLRRELDGI